MQLPLAFETTDLGKNFLAEPRTTPSPYVHKSAPRMVTADLPLGTQASFLAAAEAASSLGTPLNVLLTIRWISLFSDNDVNQLRPYPTPERIDRLVEHLRKWLVRNGAPPYYIWVRENADSVGEHWHIAFHFPKSRQTPLTHYIAKLTGEATHRSRQQVRVTEGEFARGELGSWHLTRDTRPERGGYYLAAYLGKGEPSQRYFRGKLVDNEKKPVRGMSYGGKYKDGKYDITQGLIDGTARRRDRFFIANDLKRVAGLTPQKKKLGRSQNPPDCQQVCTRNGIPGPQAST
ncbi:rolling circle replication-associated protein [Cypionkella psychrotolerans]|uniref:rolling circle replication-associated protein n=1 Tax=Cypionkella psychrotolerans TaxID=1678131 RepID=UPI0006B4D8B1|nr:hypothetical protein [Cypionkella psychrotolerans]